VVQLLRPPSGPEAPAFVEADCRHLPRIDVEEDGLRRTLLVEHAIAESKSAPPLPRPRQSGSTHIPKIHCRPSTSAPTAIPTNRRSGASATKRAELVDFAPFSVISIHLASEYWDSRSDVEPKAIRSLARALRRRARCASHSSARIRRTTMPSLGPLSIVPGYEAAGG